MQLKIERTKIPSHLMGFFQPYLCSSCYVCHLVQIFREVRRVLRSDGTFWLNLGDSYATQNAVGNRTLTGRRPGQALNCFREGYVPPYHATDNVTTGIKRIIPSGLKPKDLMGIPWKVAFALQVDGWWLRSDIIWAKGVSGQKDIWQNAYDAVLAEGLSKDVAKRVADAVDPYIGNPMPESVTDRCNKTHEYVFMLTKNERYFFDKEAIKEDAVGVSVDNCEKRNRRSVWTIMTKPYRGAHFAVFPEALVEPCIKAGTSEHGCCAVCGAPWKRVLDKQMTGRGETARTIEDGYPAGKSTARSLAEKRQAYRAMGMEGPPCAKTIGWEPTCQCGSQEIQPCLVLDPFAGSGTTGKVALDLGRSTVLIELNPEYIKLIEERCGVVREDSERRNV